MSKQFMDLVRERYSVRKFDERPVEEEKLAQILESGRLAPTATNAQPQRVYVLKSQEALEKVRAVTAMTYCAPVVLLVCYDNKVSAKVTREPDKHDTGEVDASIVATTMMMEATDLGLGTLWARGYCAQDLIDAYQLPKNIIPVCLLAVGYPAADSEPSAHHSERYPLQTMVTTL